MWKLNNTLLNNLNNKLVQGEMERVTKKYFEMKGNNNTRYQNLWNAAKPVLEENL